MSKREPYEHRSASQDPRQGGGPGDGAKVFWRSLADKENPERAQKRAESEFPFGFADVVNTPMQRRSFLTLGAIAAALVAEGCARRPVEKLMPYTKASDQITPGIANKYATVRVQRGEAIGLVVESHEGRPTKIDGNNDHPSTAYSQATDVNTQAALFDLYDPDRSRSPMKAVRMGSSNGPLVKTSWTDVDAALAEAARTHAGDQGARLRILAQPSISPTFLRLRDAILAKYPQAKIYTYAAVNDGNAREGAKIAFGQIVNVVPELAQASAILAVDCDFLGTESGSIRATRGFADGRRLDAAPRNGQGREMNRLYVVEPSVTVTGLNADHRLRLPAQHAEGYLYALAKELSTKHAIDLGPVGAAVAGAKAEGVPEKWIKAVAADLVKNRAKSVVLVGARQPARVHALAHAINAGLGNAGHTVRYYAPADATERDPVADIKALAAEIEQGKVATLLILGGNPAYDAPSDLKFADRIRSVGTTIHVSSHVDETSSLCNWHLPLAHELETWGDARALDGTRSVQQPLIAPLHGGRSEIEVLARLTNEPSFAGYDLVKGTIRATVPAVELDKVWNASLKRGVLSGSMPTPFGPLAARLTEVAVAIQQAKPGKAVGAGNIEVTFAPCPKLYDGRHANNMWLQELPDPATKICWDNVAILSPETAKGMGIENGQMLRLSREGAQPVEIAAWIMPGQADGSIALVLGWGRQQPGRYGAKHGFNVYPLRTTAGFWFGDGVKVDKLDGRDCDAMKDRLARPGLASGPSPAAGRIQPDDPFEAETYKYKISQTQEHDTMEGRPVAIDATVEEYRTNPRFVQYANEKRGRRGGSPDPKVLPLWKPRDYSIGHKWGMVIDLNACTGCNACVVACQAENNIPSVGKEQIARGREMYWIRIDRYFVGENANDPEFALQPVACVQCEEAPCENVCPVNATAHSPEGLNDMAYNRCIGTRYCANNCPYKVRRFNFLNYNGDDGKVPDTEKMHFNPDVTVRFRGVMEKCTYCVQRIQEHKIAAKREQRDLRSNEVMSACQVACPAQAITFGDLNDAKSDVARLAAVDRSYRLLADIGTHPRTSYLGKIRNPNAEMA
jgi:molybdopterin-containing oxidoreductase family iron-sulfur binding subunit